MFLLTIPISFMTTITNSMLVATIITYIYCFVFYSLSFRYPPMKIITGYAMSLIMMNLLNIVQLIVIMQVTDAY